MREQLITSSLAKDSADKELFSCALAFLSMYLDVELAHGEEACRRVDLGRRPLVATYRTYWLLLFFEECCHTLLFLVEG